MAIHRKIATLDTASAEPSDERRAGALPRVVMLAAGRTETTRAVAPAEAGA